MFPSRILSVVISREWVCLKSSIMILNGMWGNIACTWWACKKKREKDWLKPLWTTKGESAVQTPKKNSSVFPFFLSIRSKLPPLFFRFVLEERLFYSLLVRNWDYWKAMTQITFSIFLTIASMRLSGSCPSARLSPRVCITSTEKLGNQLAICEPRGRRHRCYWTNNQNTGYTASMVAAKSVQDNWAVFKWPSKGQL